MDQIRFALLLDQVSNHANGLHRLNRYRSKTQNGERQNSTPNNRRKEKLRPDHADVGPAVKDRLRKRHKMRPRSRQRRIYTRVGRGLTSATGRVAFATSATRPLYSQSPTFAALVQSTLWADCGLTHRNMIEM